MANEGQKAKTAIRAKDFRVIYGNTFGLRFSDNDVTVGIAFDTVSADGGNVLIEEAQLVITPRSAKLLAQLLTRAVENMESDAGQPFPLSAAALAAIESITKKKE